MTTEKKLEYFIETINKEVESKKRQSQHQMTIAANEEIAKAIAITNTEANTQTQAQLQAIQKIMNKRITAAQTESRRSLANLRERLIAQLFDQIKADIVTFTESTAYESFMINSIKKAQASSGTTYTYVQLTPKDANLYDVIRNATSLTPEQGDENMLGGYRLLTEPKSKSEEHTLSARLTIARQKFAEELNKTLTE